MLEGFFRSLIKAKDFTTEDTETTEKNPLGLSSEESHRRGRS